MFESCIAKQEKIRALFKGCDTDKAIYEKIIALGKTLPKLDTAFKVPENLVKGCQSQMYLRTYKDHEKLMFQAESDALISSGLAYLLVNTYSEETPETVLKCPPTFLVDLKITQSLSPNRANGLYSLYTRMKQEALQNLMYTERDSKFGF